MTGTISAMYVGGVVTLACATTWVILYLQTKEKKTAKISTELATVTYGMIWLMAETDDSAGTIRVSCAEKHNVVRAIFTQECDYWDEN
jgi:hypothetical protein